MKAYSTKKQTYKYPYHPRHAPEATSKKTNQQNMTMSKKSLHELIENNASSEEIKAAIASGADVNEYKYSAWGTPIFEAITNGAKEAVIQALIDAGADVNKDKGVPTPLSAAISRKLSLKIIQDIIDAGANVKADQWCLFNCIEQGSSIDIAKLLIKAGANVNQKNKGYWGTPLLRALVDGASAEFIRLLINAGADIKVKPDNEPLFLYAVTHCSDGKILQVLVEAGLDPHVRGLDGHNALHHAVSAKYARVEKVKFLLELGVDVNQGTYSKSNSTPIAGIGSRSWLNISDEEFTEIAKLLLDAGADANHGINNAAENGGLQSVNLLINAGAKINSKVLEWHCRSWKGADVEVIKTLIAAGADANSNVVPLSYAADNSKNGVEIIRTLIEAGAGVNRTMKHMEATPLQYIAARQKYSEEDPEIVRLLASAGAKVNAYDKKQKYGTAICAPLHWAVIRDRVEMVKVLLEVGADVNLRCREKEGAEPIPPLGMAKSGIVAQALIDAGANVNFLTQSKSTILGIRLKEQSYCDAEYVLAMLRAGAAVEYHDALVSPEPKKLLEQFLTKNKDVDKKTVRELFKKNQAQFNANEAFAKQETKPETPTSVEENPKPTMDGAQTCELNSLICKITELTSQGVLPISMLSILLEAGADVNAPHPSPLIFVKGESNTSKLVFDTLIAAGADVNIANNKSAETPLHSAVNQEQGNESIIRMLIEAGADVNVKDNAKNTPLHCAVNQQQGNENIVRMLIEAGADVNAKNNYDETPLYRAATQKNGNESIVRMLIEAEADVNAKNSFARAPLHCASKHENGNENIVRALIEGGADVNARDSKNRTPLFYVRNARCIDLLVGAGANVNAINQRGESVLYCACYDSTTEADVTLALLRAGAIVEHPLDQDANPALEKIQERTGQDIKLIRKIHRENLKKYAAKHPEAAK